MARAEFGSAKYLSKQMKARGLQKLRFYCQVCQKQCRDDNGFQSHIKSPTHVRKISQISQADIEEYTKNFEADFLRTLRLTHGEKKIEANKFYNEFIQDKNHIHMNATRFTSLTRFIQHLGKAGKIRVHGVADSKWDDDEIDMGQLLISYIDRSQENLLRSEKLAELQRNEPKAQELKAIMLQRQIENSFKNIEQHREEDIHDVPRDSVVLPSEGKIHLTLETPNSNKAKKKNRIHKKNVFGV